LDARAGIEEAGTTVTGGRRIPVSAPALDGNEKAYVLDCLESTWISSIGKYVGRFEAAFAEFCGVRHALTCSSGTAALHLALAGLGVGPDDEVIVPTLTFVATANAVSFCGARPVLVDSEPRAWTIDPALVEARIGPRTKGIVAVHLWGHPADMDALREIARRHGLFLLEDAAQAHGAEYCGARAGSLGDVATFSFYGNKIITTGEGGMVTTDDAALAERMRMLRGHGMDPERRYWHPVIGYNYRMTNVAAAIGLAQIERIDERLTHHRRLADWYREELADAPGLTWQVEMEWARHAWWMVTPLLGPGSPAVLEEVIPQLARRGVEARPVVYPVHQLPPYAPGAAGERFPVAERVARLGINLPSGAGLTRDDVRYVAEALIESLTGAVRT
jgi:perosamine synthetase